MRLPIRLAGSGVYVPRRTVAAADLDAQLGLAPGTTLARNGVATRYFADDTETASMMGAAAIGAGVGALVPRHTRELIYSVNEVVACYHGMQSAQLLMMQ